MGSLRSYSSRTGDSGWTFDIEVRRSDIEALISISKFCILTSIQDTIFTRLRYRSTLTSNTKRFDIGKSSISKFYIEVLTSILKLQSNMEIDFLYFSIENIEDSSISKIHRYWRFLDIEESSISKILQYCSFLDIEDSSRNLRY